LFKEQGFFLLRNEGFEGFYLNGNMYIVGEMKNALMGRPFIFYPKCISIAAYATRIQNYFTLPDMLWMPVG
jgi:hypothetical protein